MYIHIGNHRYRIHITHSQIAGRTVSLQYGLCPEKLLCHLLPAIVVLAIRPGLLQVALYSTAHAKNLLCEGVALAQDALIVRPGSGAQIASALVEASVKIKPDRAEIEYYNFSGYNSQYTASAAHGEEQRVSITKLTFGSRAAPHSPGPCSASVSQRKAQEHMAF